MVTLGFNQNIYVNIEYTSNITCIIKTLQVTIGAHKKLKNYSFGIDYFC